MNEKSAAHNSRIMIMDDESYWIDFAVHNLEAFDVVVVRSREEAVEHLKRDSFDAIILDAHYLPFVREIRPMFHQRVAVASLAPTINEARNAYRDGATHYFAKSFSRRDLLRELQEVLPGARVG